MKFSLVLLLAVAATVAFAAAAVHDTRLRGRRHLGAPGDSNDTAPPSPDGDDDDDDGLPTPPVDDDGLPAPPPNDNDDDNGPSSPDNDDDDDDVVDDGLPAPPGDDDDNGPAPPGDDDGNGPPSPDNDDDDDDDGLAPPPNDDDEDAVNIDGDVVVVDVDDDTACTDMSIGKFFVPTHDWIQQRRQRAVVLPHIIPCSLLHSFGSYLCLTNMYPLLSS